MWKGVKATPPESTCGYGHAGSEEGNCLGRAEDSEEASVPMEELQEGRLTSILLATANAHLPLHFLPVYLAVCQLLRLCVWLTLWQSF